MLLYDLEQPELGDGEALDILSQGKVELTRLALPWSSNHTFLVRIEHRDVAALAIYKPRRGEAPLWDFPEGTLCQREVAAYVVSQELGWRIVPSTIMREGPMGMGMLQIFVPHDPNQNYFTFGTAQQAQLRRIALFDHLVNNADRKGGHCLLDREQFLWGIDHGICFHAQPKLRTVIWDFAGDPIPADLLADLEIVQQNFDQLYQKLESLLSRSELVALQSRLSRLIEMGHYPDPGPGRNFPWPPV